MTRYYYIDDMEDTTQGQFIDVVAAKGNYLVERDRVIHAIREAKTEPIELFERLNELERLLVVLERFEEHRPQIVLIDEVKKYLHRKN